MFFFYRILIMWQKTHCVLNANDICHHLFWLRQHTYFDKFLDLAVVGAPVGIFLLRYAFLYLLAERFIAVLYE